MTGSRLAWVDATSGVAGDMLLGACLDAGADIDAVQTGLDSLGLGIKVIAERVVRGGLGATLAVVAAPESPTHRRLADIRELLTRLDGNIARRADAVFTALAEAEARVHGTAVADVHFHEVGALDAIADVVGVLAALDDLGVGQLSSSTIALGGGRATTLHGSIPVPGPAVLELLRLRGAPASGGPVDVELATPTGVALLTVLADEFTSMPLMRPDRIGTGAGTRELPGHANVTRLVLGSVATAGDTRVESATLLETNVDDLDPRVWPSVLAELLSAGASDAWLTPILMKKGRPAHTLSVLAPPDRVDALETIVFEHTSTIGLRRTTTSKVALAREIITVEVLGERVRVKLARRQGRVVHATPEYEDVADLARRLERPVREILELARLAADAAR